MFRPLRLFRVLPLAGLALACNAADDSTASATDTSQSTITLSTVTQSTTNQSTVTQSTTNQSSTSESTTNESTTNESTTNESTTDEPTTGGPTTGSAGDGPVVQELLSNPSVLEGYNTITFTAIVSDPDGLDTIVAGKLVSPDDSAFYGAFASLGGGTYQLVLSWDMINTASPINFMGFNQVREFKADFSDIDGNHGFATIMVTLDCAAKLANACNGEPCMVPAACNGDCVDLFTFDEHCGECGFDCDIFQCYAGKCA